MSTSPAAHPGGGAPSPTREGRQGGAVDAARPDSTASYGDHVLALDRAPREADRAVDQGGGEVGSPPSSNAGARRAAAILVGALAAVLTLAGPILAAWLGWSWSALVESFVLSNALIGASFGLCGALIAWHRPDNPVGWWFAVGGLLQAISGVSAPIAEALGDAGHDAGARLASTACMASWPWAIGLCYPLGLMYFPDGRLPGRAWRWPVWAYAATAPLFVAEMAGSPDEPSEALPVTYVAIAAYERLGWLWTIAELRTIGGFVLALACLSVRFRSAAEPGRSQLLWLMLGLIGALGAMLPWGLVTGTPVLVLLAIPLIPLSVAVAIVRHQAFDIRTVLSRTLAAVILSLAVVVAYAVLVAVLDRFVRDRVGSSATATVILVLVAAPLLPRLRRAVHRALYGDRADPVRVVSRVGAELAVPGGEFHGVVGSIRSTLRLPYVALRDNAGRLTESGTPADESFRTDLVHDGEVVGALLVRPRRGEDRLAAADRDVLTLLSAPLAATVHAVAVTDQLAASRERIVEAREEERRRLRRDLHDGLGPTLTGLALTADAAANHVADPERVTALLTALRRDIREALADVKRLVEDLRPPALDELGLRGALAAPVERLGRRGGDAPLTVDLDVPERLPELPAAVEVAAYRIVTEALTNIARHSGAGHASVRLRADRDLVIEVTDDGASRAAWTPGVGLTSMRERADELRGTVDAGPTPDGGRIVARIPLGER